MNEKATYLLTGLEKSGITWKKQEINKRTKRLHKFHNASRAIKTLGNKEQQSTDSRILLELGQ